MRGKMSDPIDRQDAINILRHHLDEDYLDGYVYWNELKAIPSAEPERKKGEWIYDGKRGRFPACKCSICGHYENADWALLQGVNYCPNCGADMRGE
jgi:hypothetical protein